MRPIRTKTLSYIAIAAIVSFGMLLFSHKQADVDLWGNLGFVKALPGSDAFLRVNTFSFTEPEHAWTNHEWMGEYVLHKIYKIGGGPLLLLLKTLWGLLIVYLLNLSLKRSCTSPTVRFFFLLLVMSTIGYGFSTRPHLFTYLMLVLLLLGIQLRPAALACAALPAGIIWVNLHGAFFIGIIILLTYLLGLALQLKTRPQNLKHLIYASVAVLLFCLASLINPYGASIWSFITESAAKSRTYLSEWAPFNPLANFSDHSDFIILSLICLISINRKSVPALHWLLIGSLSLCAALVMRRNIPVFALVSVFACAPAVDRRFGKEVESLTNRLSHNLKLTFLVILTAASLCTLGFRHGRNPMQIEVDSNRFPVGTVRFIREHQLTGNILAFFDWAEYCIWELYPDCHVYLDGRYRSAYSEAAIDSFFDFIYAAETWEKALDNGTSMVLIHQDNPVFKNMSIHPDWTLVCKDNASALFLKTSIYADQIKELKELPVLMETKGPVVFK